MTTRHPTAVFQEVQHVRQAKFGIILLIAGAAMIAFMSWTMYEQLVEGRPVGDNPMSDSVLMWLGPLYLLIGVGMLYLFWAGKLISEVRPDGVYIQFVPFHRGFRRFAYEDIDVIEARQYSPIREYGGWGMRYGPKGGAFNMYGNRGVQFVFKNGRRVLVGSQQADTMVDAIRSFR